MQQFEKYWKKHNPQRGILCDDFRRAGYIWRDALGMVLGWLDYSSEHKEIADKIHDELE